MDTQRSAARMGTALPSLVRWGLSPDADLVYRTLVALDTAREGQLAHELGMSHERVREAVRELAAASAIRRVSATSGHREPKATGRAVWAARQPSQVVRQLHGHRVRPLTVAVPGPDPATRAEPGTRQSPPRDLPIPAPAPFLGRPAGHVTPLLPPGPDGDTAPACPGKPSTVVGLPTGAPDPAHGRSTGGFPGLPAPVPVAGHIHPEHGTRPRPWLPTQTPRHHTPAPPPGPPMIALTPRERAIVELLAQGHTDETAARELELSRRTVGYALGGLMSRLGVDNRFQLGLALGAMRAAVPAPRSPTKR